MLLPPLGASLRTYAHSAPALARLVHTAMQYVSTVMQQHPSEQQLPWSAVDLLGVAGNAARVTILVGLIASLQSQGEDGMTPGMLASMPQAADMFMSPHYIPSLVLATCVTVFGSLGVEQWQQAAAAAAVNAASSSSGSWTYAEHPALYSRCESVLRSGIRRMGAPPLVE